jgi:signal transduction histidine kinase
LIAFLLIVGGSFYVMATSLTSLVGDYLFEQRIRTDRISVEKLAVELEPLYRRAQVSALTERLKEAGGELGGRLLLLDTDGKVQFDSFSEIYGVRLQYPEVLGILMQGKTVDYGLHKITVSGDASGSTVLSFLRPLNTSVNWVGYCTAALNTTQGVIGVLLFSSPVQSMMQGLYQLQDQMILYFLIVAGVVLVIALIFSRVITKPIAVLTRGIQRMGRGDFSARVAVKGSGELKRLAETFNTMSEKLEVLDKSRNQFVSNASHELKTPLATMKILLESVIYQPEMEPELRTEFMTDINKEIDRLSLIISDLLTLVQMDTKNMKLNRQNIRMAELVRDTIHNLMPMAQKRQQAIQADIQDEGEMYADGIKLQQVVYNLMENAVKYTQPGGRIQVRLFKTGKDVNITISDNGPGIPKDDLPHIFDRFYRVDKARSRETGGTGLGLSIVKQIVLLHGGNVTVKSEEGQGATFIVELPAHSG